MRRPAPTIVLAVGVLAVLAHSAFAYRPFDQTDGDTAELNTIELEIGPFTIWRGSSTTSWQPYGVFNYGFSDGWELVIDIDTYLWSISSPSSFVWSDVEVKHVLREGCLQEKRGPSVALEVGPLLPTLPQLGDEVGWSTDLIVSECWDPITVHANFQVEYERNRELEESVGAIVEGPRDWRVRPVGEAYLEHSPGSDELSILAGAIWTYRKSLTFDAALRTLQTIEGTTPASYQIRVGLTWVFGV
jgi:hypothetical protein